MWTTREVLERYIRRVLEQQLSYYCPGFPTASGRRDAQPLEVSSAVRAASRSPGRRSRRLRRRWHSSGRRSGRWSGPGAANILIPFNDERLDSAGA
jgi:hypothetical protein